MGEATSSDHHNEETFVNSVEKILLDKSACDILKDEIPSFHEICRKELRFFAKRIFDKLTDANLYKGSERTGKGLARNQGPGWGDYLANLAAGIAYG